MPSQPRILLLADHPRWTLGRWAQVIAGWFPDLTIEVRYPGSHPTELRPDQKSPALIHALYPPLWLRLRHTFRPESPVFLSFHSERALAALPDLLRARARERWRLFVGGVSPAIVQRLAVDFDAPDFLPDGIFGDEWPARAQPTEGRPRIGMVGLLAREKGFHDLLQPELVRRGLAPITHWKGPPPEGFPDAQLLPPGFVAALYRRMDLYAMLSASEGTPMPLLEAMASGVAAVATRTGAAEELVVPGLTGELLDARTPEALTRALDRLPQDRAALYRLGQRARERVLRLRPAEASLAALRRAYARALSLEEPLRTCVAARTPLSITLVTAHPDDELLWAGGLIALHPWHRWRIVCATGSAETPRGIELRAVAANLGAEATLLGLADRADCDLEPALAPLLGEALAGSDLLLSHGPEGEYGHPHHRAVHRALAAWRQRHAPAVPLWCFAMRDGEALALPPRIAARKSRLLALYRAEGRRFRVLEHAAASSGREHFRASGSPPALSAGLLP